MQQVTVTLEEAEAIAMAIAEIRKHPLPATAGIRTRKLLRRINAELEDFKAEYEALIDKHALRDDDGEKVVKITEDKQSMVSLKDSKAFTEELAKLKSESITIDGEQLREEDFGKSLELFPACLLDVVLERFGPQEES